MFQLLRSNFRDILAFLVISIICCVLLDLLTDWSVSQDLAGRSIPGLALFISLLLGFSRFAAANLCAWLLGVAVGWPTINRWGSNQDTFLHAWNSLHTGQRLNLFIAVAGIELLAAAIIFAP